MPLFLIITKLLLLKIFSVSVEAYEFGYHPSAEERDSFLRETSRTWTRDLLANDRRHVWRASLLQRRSDNAGSGEYFVPKFKYEKERNAFESKLNLKWPGYTEQIVRRLPRPATGHGDQQIEPSLVEAEVVEPQNIDTRLDFEMFSDEAMAVHNPSSPSNPSSFLKKHKTKIVHKPEQSSASSHGIFNKFEKIQKVTMTPATPPNPAQLKPTKTSHGNIIQIANDLNESVSHSSDVKKWQNKYSLNNLYKNNTEANFPIFFTNPVTGIVYAITEIGRNKTQTQRPKGNNSIPIYITKEQYDRDILLLRKQYEDQCSSGQSGISATLNKKSTLATTTQRPQIVRLPKPAVISKLPTKLNDRKPSLVTVQSAPVGVIEQVNVPPPKRSQKVKHKRTKKKKKPGRPHQNLAALKGFSHPEIIFGTRTTTRRPAESRELMTSQLERPNLPPTTTIFDSRPIAATSGYVLPKDHHLIKRSVLDPTENTTAATTTTTSTTQRSETAPTESVATKTKTKKKHRKVKKKKKIALGFRNRNDTTAKSATEDPPKIHRRKSNKNLNLNKKRKSTKRDKDDDDGEGFDILDLLDGNDDDDSEKDEDDDSEYYYDDETKKKSKRKNPHRNSSHETQDSADDDDDDDDNDDAGSTLKEQILHDNSSSAEEGADFGALEEFDTPFEEQHQEPSTPEFEPFSSETKNTYGHKKLIRRRPASSASYEDYNNKDDDDNDGGDNNGENGIGGFFRMLFYPVQVVMERIADTISGTNADSSEEENDHKTGFPTYTQYSSATNAAPDSEEADEEQGSSLGSWFSSLFGFNRRTKKIGSTTAAPQSTPPDATEAPGWFESWFGFGGSKPSSSDTSDDYDDYDKWFSSWFGTQPKAKRRRATTSTTTTTTATIPQVPILTIVDPMKNPHNWLGILAHHIINATTTTTTTRNPLIQALKRATTTQNPDIPRLISYDKYQIWRLKPQNEANVKVLEDYKRSDEGAKLQWLKGPSLRGLTDVLVPPKMLIDFQGTLQFESIAHEILIFDVGKAIAYEQTKEQFYLTTPRPHKHQHQQQKQKYASLINMSWSKYYGYDDIIKYLESVRMRHPQIVELFHIGRSYEGRPLVVAKLEMNILNSGTSDNGTAQTNQKKLRHKKKSGQANAVFIEAGTHGLEWIGPATATWMINELLRVMKSNKSTPEMDFIRNTTWYVMPVLNPDGYVYSHEYDRFWRKSRSRHISRPGGLINSAMTWLHQKKIPGKVCYGVDLDRNWHYQWGKRGSSKTACNEHFAGPAAFSEPETKALSEFLMDNRKQIKLFISMQAYGQIISYPTKVNATYDRERLEDFMDVAMAGVDGLRKKGNKSRYKIDSANDLIEHRAGCSDAFAAYEVGVPFSYTLYLADNGVHGYLLPSSSIEPTARDAFEIIISMLDYI